MALSTPVGGSLLNFNTGLGAAIGAIFPMGPAFNGLAAQIDALLSIGLSPYQTELSLQFNASLAAQATLTLQIGDPTQALQLAISSLAQLQAALSAALAFPPINLSLSAELSASAALAGALSARLGVLKVAIEVALKIKTSGLKLLLGSLDIATDLEAKLNAGPAWAFSFEDGGSETLETLGNQIQALFSAGVGTGGDKIYKDDTDVYGVVMLTKVPAVQTALSAIITV